MQTNHVYNALIPQNISEALKQHFNLRLHFCSVQGAKAQNQTGPLTASIKFSLYPDVINLNTITPSIALKNEKLQLYIVY